MILLYIKAAFAAVKGFLLSVPRSVYIFIAGILLGVLVCVPFACKKPKPVPVPADRVVYMDRTPTTEEVTRPGATPSGSAIFDRERPAGYQVIPVPPQLQGDHPLADNPADADTAAHYTYDLVPPRPIDLTRDHIVLRRYDLNEGRWVLDSYDRYPTWGVSIGVGATSHNLEFESAYAELEVTYKRRLELGIGPAVIQNADGELEPFIRGRLTYRLYNF